MKSYSEMLMRRERIPVLSLIALGGAVCLAFAAYFGALWIVGKEISLLFAGACFFLFLLCAGWHLFATDETRLLRKTLYGKTLLSYAGGKDPAMQRKDAEKAARALLAEIDREAAHMLYACGGFALTEHWIILYERPAVSTWLKGTVKALPVPRRDIRKITWESADRAEGSGYLVRIWTTGTKADPHRILTYEQASIQALRQWSAVQEKWDI